MRVLQEKSEELVHQRANTTERISGFLLYNASRVKNSHPIGRSSTDDCSNELQASLRACDFIDSSIFSPQRSNEAVAATPSTNGAAYGSTGANTRDVDTVIVETTVPSTQADLSERKFEALPATVRGRSKYSEVEATYSKLVAITKDALSKLPKFSKSAPLSSDTMPRFSRKELAERGLKVIGKTGDSVVIVLRTLGLVVVDGRSDIALSLTKALERELSAKSIKTRPK